MSTEACGPGGEVFTMPDLGEGLTEADVVRWLVAEGEHVAIDQPLLEVETAKSVVEVPSPYAGPVVALHADAGSTVAVGAALVTVGRVAESIPADAAAGAAAQTYREEERAGSGNVLIGFGTSESTGRGRRRRPRRATPATTRHDPFAERARPTADATASAGAVPRAPGVVSPLVRRLARDGGLDVAHVVPAADDGIVRRADVIRALAESIGPEESPGAGSHDSSSQDRTRVPMGSAARAAARQFSRSRTEIPEATVWVDVDATPLWELRESLRTPDDPGPGILAFLARFTIAGLRRYPVLNSVLDVERDEIVQHDHVHLGLAVQSSRGLVVPTIRRAETLTTRALGHAIHDVVGRTRAGQATRAELTGGTFTLNSYGGFRVDGSTPIINHPQVGILGFGRILDRPWVVDGQLAIRKVTAMSFAFDHRVCDGSVAAEFMRVVADAVESPAAAIRDL